MLATWAKALAVFPVSTLAPGIRELAVYPFEWGETPVLEQSFQEGAVLEEVVPMAAESAIRLLTSRDPASARYRFTKALASR